MLSKTKGNLKLKAIHNADGAQDRVEVVVKDQR